MSRRGRSRLEGDAQASTANRPAQTVAGGCADGQHHGKEAAGHLDGQRRKLNSPPRGRGGRERDKKFTRPWSVPKRPATRPGTNLAPRRLIASRKISGAFDAARPPTRTIGRARRPRRLRAGRAVNSEGAGRTTRKAPTANRPARARCCGRARRRSTPRQQSRWPPRRTTPQT